MNELILLIIFLLLSAFSSAAETALTSVSWIKVKKLLEEKAPGAKILKSLKEKPSDFLSSLLIANNLINIGASAYATSITIKFLEGRGWGGIGTAVGISTGSMTFLILVFGEITPKTLAIRNAEKFALFSAPIVLALQVVLKPIAYLIGFFSRPFIQLLGGKVPEKVPFITEEELRLILQAGAEEGVIEKEEREMITSIFEFGDTIAREVMTPRPDIIAIEANQPMDKIMQSIIESGHSRLPVYEGNLDNIIGLIYAKDMLKVRKGDLKEYLRPVIFIPETKKISDLLHEMQSARTHIAVIIDEYGMNSGLVTMEDIIEEIVGDIHDEFEREEKSIVKIDESTTLLDGRNSLADVNDQLDINLPEDEYDTIGGFVFGQLGKAPAVGDSLRYTNLVISVERIHRRRITRVKMVKLPRKIEDEVVGG
ncbi:MAG: hemolysin family protein [Candidatus Margulisbacteria bacterium]|nr:hemolysin family protein [Candidatus Margulisiibacteriota bacterium]